MGVCVTQLACLRRFLMVYIGVLQSLSPWMAAYLLDKAIRFHVELP